MTLLFISRILITIVILWIGYFCLHRTWTKNVDVIGQLKKWTDGIAETVVPVRDEVLKPNISIRTEPLSVSKFTSNPISENDRKYLRQHCMKIVNGNDFPITALKMTVRFPEPVLGIVWVHEPVGSTPKFIQQSSEGTRIFTNGMVVGNTLPLDRVWSLSVDKIPAHDQIEILLLTTIAPKDSAMSLYMRRIAQNPGLIPPTSSSVGGVTVHSFSPSHFRDIVSLPEPQSGIIVDFIEGTFQNQKGDGFITNTFFAQIFLDSLQRSFSAGVTLESEGKLQVERDSVAFPKRE